MIPNLYTQKQVEEILRHSDRKSLFHWTSSSSAKSIFARRELLSKGSVWGLGISISPKKTTAIDTQNGFVDYVFLGVSNWKSYGMRSYYGEIGLEFCTSVILDREFFVFPRNTGMSWAGMACEERDSDLSKLRSALCSSSKTNEILVRRRIVLSSETLLAVHCPETSCQEIRDVLGSIGMAETPVCGYTVGGRGGAMQQGSVKIEITHPILTDNRTEVFSPEDYLEERDFIWISRKELSCVLELKKAGEDLVDPVSNRKFGRIIRS